MQWLFDMFSGTSTGSLLSGAMAVFDDKQHPKDNLKNGFKRPLYWGSDATSIYQDASPLIFRYNGVAPVIKALVIIASIILISFLCYLLGNRMYYR